MNPERVKLLKLLDALRRGDQRVSLEMFVDAVDRSHFSCSELSLRPDEMEEIEARITAKTKLIV